MDATAPDNEIYVTLAGQIDLEMVKRVFNGFSLMTQQQQRVTKIHLLFHSPGGFITDGIALYNFFKQFPIPIVAYNSGNVASIATIVYLAAERRKASASASFMIHKTHTSLQSGTRSASLKLIAESIDADDIRSEAILRPVLTLSEEQWTIHAHADLNFNADQALACGLIHEVGEFKPPHGSQIFNI
jgi:ATP-dependent Clp protease protease subunit